MASVSPDFAVKYRTARGALFGLLSDCGWHSHAELGQVAGNRYSARLLELRRLGYLIESCDLETGKAYRLVSAEPGEPQDKRVKVFLSESAAASIERGVPDQAAVDATRRALRSFRANRGKL